MKIRHLHSWDLTPTEAVALQRELASQVDTRTPLTRCTLIAGADVSYSDVNVACGFDVGSGAKTGALVNTRDVGVPFAVADAVTLAGPTDVHLQCLDDDAHTHVSGIVMTALAVGTIHS